jgi:hypothetical protein
VLPAQFATARMLASGRMTSHRLECVWRVDRDAPAIATWLEGEARWAFDWLTRSIEDGVHVGGPKPFDDGTYVRLPMQRRCFYMKTTGPAVLAFKGTEPLAVGFAEELGRMKRERAAGPLPLIDVYPLFEQKLPLAVGLDEALGEARAAAQLQEPFLRKYAQPAIAPVPIAVFQLPREAELAYREQVLGLAGKRTAKLVTQLEQALGVYVYYYPHLPVRVLHAENADSFPERVEKLVANPHAIHPLDALTSLVTTIARMFSVGLLPLSSDAFYIGTCISPQNVTLQGGICDVDSIVAIDELTTDAERHMCALSVITMLSATVKALLVGKLPPVTWGFPDPTVSSALFISYIHAELRKACARECPDGLPAFLQRLLDDPAAAIGAYLEAMYPRLNEGRSEHLTTGRYDGVRAL